MVLFPATKSYRTRLAKLEGELCFIFSMLQMRKHVMSDAMRPDAIQV